MKKNTGKRLIVTQIASAIRREENQSECLRALGLGKIGKQVSLQDTPQIHGLIKKVKHLLKVAE